MDIKCCILHRQVEGMGWLILDELMKTQDVDMIRQSERIVAIKMILETGLAIVGWSHVDVCYIFGVSKKREK